MSEVLADTAFKLVELAIGALFMLLGLSMILRCEKHFLDFNKKVLKYFILTPTKKFLLKHKVGIFLLTLGLIMGAFLSSYYMH